MAFQGIPDRYLTTRATHGSLAQASPTPSDEFDECLENAVERADERATNGEGSKLGRFIKFSMDVAHCTADYISPFN